MEVSRPITRCMGGRFCDHTPGTCTATQATQEALPGLEPTPEPEQQSLPGIPYVPGAISFRCLGKQVLKDGVHYADAADPDAAEYIVHALNSMVAQTDWAYLIARVR